MNGVILLHGLGRSTLSMRSIERRLAHAGLETASIGYASRSMGLKQATAVLLERIRARCAGWDRIHVVGHSLGGLLALHLKAAAPDLPWGRIVQLGSPNKGSRLANVIDRSRLMREALGPALTELRAGMATPLPGGEIAAIAGTAGWTPLTSIYGLHGPNDGKVTVTSALAAAPKHRLALPVGHALMLQSPRVGEAVEHFLLHGRFPAKEDEE